MTEDLKTCCRVAQKLGGHTCPICLEPVPPADLDAARQAANDHAKITRRARQAVASKGNQ